MRQGLALGFALGAAALALSGCIPPGGPEADMPAGTPGAPPAAPGTAPVPIEADSITLQTGPCFGRCPVYSVTVRPDGSGVFNGGRFTAVAGERRFVISRAQFDDFAARLAPYRPRTGEIRYAQGEERCGPAPTDMPSAEVTWTRAIGDSQRLYFYFGCRSANAALADTLGHAADALPIQDLIGARP